MERELRDIDSIKSLIEYFQRNLKKGYKVDSLKWALINQGHSRTEIDRAVKYVLDMQEAQKAKKAEEEKPEPPKVETIPEEEEKSSWRRFKDWFAS